MEADIRAYPPGLPPAPGLNLHQLRERSLENVTMYWKRRRGLFRSNKIKDIPHFTKICGLLKASS